MRRALGAPAVAFAIASAATLVTLPPGARAQSAPLAVAIDGAHSRARFSVTHVYVTRVSGTVPIVAGSIALGAGGVPSRVEATLDPRRVDTGNGDRDEDLQGPDWFDTARFPAWTFASTAVRPAAGGFALDGVLTVHGVAQPVTLLVTTTGTTSRPAYHATGTIPRHAFGMRTTPIDGLIGNDVELTLDIATKPAGG